jgi:predicted nucleotidyltransferase
MAIRESKSESIDPPFSTRNQAVGFAVLLLALLGLPLLFGKAHLIRREHVYAAVPEEWGAFSYIHRQIFEETSDIDLLIIATSHLYQGLDGVYLRNELSRRLGREATVISLSTNWRSEALNYQLLRDILARRKVRMVLTSMPNRLNGDTLPHLQSYRWHLYGQDDADLEGLPLSSRLTFHAQTVLGFPRQMLSLARHNRISDARWAATCGTQKVDRGIGKELFLRFTPTPPKLDPQSITYRPGSPAFAFTGQKLSEYQRHFLGKFMGLLREHRLPLTIVHIPLWLERHDAVVKERLNWAELYDVRMALIGVPPGALFHGLTEKEIDLLYYNDDDWPNHHLNRNGNEFFTQAIAPAIMASYEHNVSR